jgi:AcrR family transcriptional regulator
MARAVKEDIYQARRNEILDVAQQLVMVTKGFTQMSIQDILDELGISKGAFYHYFDSKHALLEALIERVIEEATPMMTAIVDDPDSDAMAKLHRFFHSAGRWKTARKEYLMSFLQVWYADENAITREKLRLATPDRFGPLLDRIVRQGMDEGVFDTPYPDQVGRIMFMLVYDMGVEFASFLRVRDRDPEALHKAERMVAGFNNTVERLIGAPEGSVELMEPEVIRAWFEPMGDEASEVQPHRLRAGQTA